MYFKLRNVVVLIIVLTAFLSSSQSVFAKDRAFSDLSEKTKDLIGTPYVWGGTTGKGFDCSGFVGYVYNLYGIELPRTSASMFADGDKISDIGIGDLVFFATYKKTVSHVGIYLGNNKFIHAGSGGVSVADIDSEYWRDKFLGARRYI